MNSFQSTSRRLGRVAGASLLMILIGATAGFASAGTHDHKHKPLSLSNVILNGPQTATMALTWIGAAQGYFAQQGLNVSVDNSAESAATDLALLLSGSVQFRTGNSSTTIEAAQSGAPIRALFMDQMDNAQDIVINQAFAAAHNIPTTGDSEGGAVAQLLALKGSHATLGVSGTTSDSYTWAYSIARAHGLTVGSTAGSTADINIVTEGSSAATVLAAFEAGKTDGLINTPPTTVISSPPNIVVQLAKIPPATTSAAEYTFTTLSMVQQHPDTCQAVVNAYTEAMAFAHSHPASAEKEVGRVFATLGFTSPEEQQYLFADTAPYWIQPFPTKQSYDDTLKLINPASVVPITVPYASFVYSRFASSALKQFKNLTF